MAAVLRAAGKNFDVESYLRDCRLPNPTSYKRGEPRFKSRPDRGLRVNSGVNIVASEADFASLSQQILDAAQFLSEHAAEIHRLRSFPGVERVTLDFGIWRREVVMQCDAFPESLVKIAGELGLGLELTLYARDED